MIVRGKLFVFFLLLFYITLITSYYYLKKKLKNFFKKNPQNPLPNTRSSSFGNGIVGKRSSLLISWKEI
jgi:hypothetical protein